jgi:predicted nucleic acid-binding protein
VIAVDTSVWIDFFRGRGPVSNALVASLDRDEVALPAPVRIELLAGVRTAEQARLRRLLSALPILSPSQDIWATIEAWVVVATAAGHRFGLGDLLIAAIAAEQGIPVWSLDSDFARMEKLGFVRLEHRK